MRGGLHSVQYFRLPSRSDRTPQAGQAMNREGSPSCRRAFFSYSILRFKRSAASGPSSDKYLMVGSSFLIDNRRKYESASPAASPSGLSCSGPASFRSQYRPQTEPFDRSPGGARPRCAPYSFVDPVFEPYLFAVSWKIFSALEVKFNGFGKNP